MLLIMYFSIIIMIILILLILMLNLFSKKTFFDREKNSPFECGFNPKNSARLPFSLHFFLIAVIFLIFDVEITLLFPMILMINIINLYNYYLFMFFILILLMGLYHEWNQGALTWTI
uniref:NADH-ubiquinone oxidoreductase chain 3 n=2 Tax=Coleoptera TaxID=7041 RepID=A0A346RFL8_9COLE|nr:NADH dehydrogenase subunit 3 [Coleoptera sp. 2 KM-2017]AXS66006.1 NADH dehydrogenase subunit 3 [Cucujoidea sp. 36 KM-2017]